MVYADNAATTKISDSVLEKMLPFLQEQYGNASSQYSLGTKARRAIENARKQIALAISAESSEIVFTSGGSEANNWVLKSVVESFNGNRIHVITSSIEHPSIMNTCRALEIKGVDVTYVPVDNAGRVLVDEVRAAIRSNTKLVSIMLANNEIGTIQPISEIGNIVRERGILFHTDAVQAVGHIPVDVIALNIDLLTASAHKFNGAKGTGFLYIRKDIALSPMILGGEQEQKHRAGTENVAGIVAAGYALEESIIDIEKKAAMLIEMTDATIKNITKKIPSSRLNGGTERRLPGIVNFCFEGVSGESLMHLLDLKKICVSTSSACNTGKNEPSHVLLALGLNEQQAKSAIRISYGRDNSFEDVDIIVSAIYDSYKKIKDL